MNVSMETHKALEKRVRELEMRVICCNCGRLKDQELDRYTDIKLLKHNQTAEDSHGICPRCTKELYPDYVQSVDIPQKD